MILTLAVCGRAALAQQKAPPKEYRPYTQDAPYKSQGEDITAGPYYRMLARQALEEQPKDFSFAMFRGRYAMTVQYDPEAHTALERLLGDAYQLQEGAKDPAARAAAAVDYNKVLFDHLANIDVVTQALSLARQDTRLGDAKALEWIRAGLAQSVMQSGTGKTLNEAYDILTLGEETALLAGLGVQVLRTDARESGGTYYNMHLVRDSASGEEYTVFTDLSRPMRCLEEKRALERYNKGLSAR